MKFALYDAGGCAVAYCDHGRHLYAFQGAALAYVDGDSIYAFHGEHLGWWDHGWVRDHDGACVFFTELAVGEGPALPPRQERPAKAAKQAPRHIAYSLPKPPRAHDVPSWSPRSGMLFFPPRR
jgi:hypothetical protein